MMSTAHLESQVFAARETGASFAWACPRQFGAVQRRLERRKTVSRWSELL
jgi:hypothetical protein